MSGYSILNAKHIGRGKLLASCDVVTPDGIRILDVCVLERDGKRWLSFRAGEFIRKDGAKGLCETISFGRGAKAVR
jgi:hypothetical protein